jgi:excisionase family DNA binding protein
MKVKKPVALAAPIATNGNDTATHVISPHTCATQTHVSPAEAAKYLSVSEHTLAIWRCTKRYPLKYIKVGRLVRYRVTDLDAFLTQRTVVAQHGDQEAL